MWNLFKSQLHSPVPPGGGVLSIGMGTNCGNNPEELLLCAGRSKKKGGLSIT